MATESGEKVLNSGRWDEKEHKKFLQGMRVFGRNWSKVSAMNVLLQPKVYEFEQNISAIGGYQYCKLFRLVPSHKSRSKQS